ncbi:hypothetical protein LTR36_007552 [Oleoguttula mirabilis]|uniref:Uncharacterized protein n=1 Tax=Oleoguttula mirabilis TaxID=1507867 RepID=A0AAV9JVK6_9PEZI|nr:hypothetical protein LTR36_007552 [Oleoguttula mirabilis]
MSGNPFRRSQGSRLPDEITQSDELNTQPPAKTRTKKKKRVVIQTPPHSPEEPSIPRRLSDETGSPPPPVTRAADEDTDSTTTADSDLEQALVNTRRNSGSVPPPPTSFGILAGTRAPYNPFARTLETTEARFAVQSRQEGPLGKETLDGAAAQAWPGAGKPALDVDAFKNILMGGGAVPPPPVAAQQQPKPQDSSSSTDTSSVSRQSIFDPMHEAHPESPRTSFDDHHSASDDDGDDEHSSLMGPVSSRPVEEGPPRPPKHTHGRVYPQTVSFADFDESIPATYPPAAPRTPPVNTQLLQGIMRPSTPRSPSDLNKPLPPPPAEPMPPLDAVSVPQQSIPASQQPPVVAPVAEEQPPAKKAPPPPPTSRRQGTTGAGQGRPRSESNLSQSSARQPEADKPLKATDNIIKPAPPPPPSRRTLPVSNSPVPAIETPPSVPSPTQAPAEPNIMPPPPPRRQARSGASVSRTPSNASRTSLPRSDSFSTMTAASGQAPPAPPPRRGGATKRNSMDGPPNTLSTRRASGIDHRRASGQSFESDRTPSISSLQQVDEPGEIEQPHTSSAPIMTANGSRDILADMFSLQAEIEALRAQTSKAG